VKAAAEQLLAEETALITEEVRKALRREAPKIASQLVDHLGDKAKNAYGVSVELRFPNSY
jgi:hypothetical protein